MALRSFVLIRTEPQETESVVRALREIEGVREVSRTLGPVDILAQVEVREPEELNRVVVERVRKVKGIRETTTLLSLERFER